MTTVAYSKTFPTSGADLARYQAVSVLRWTPLVNGDDGGALGPDFAQHTDRSVQVLGTFGTGGTVLIEGSLDGSTWATLSDPQGNALSIQSAKIEAIMEATPYLRPRVSAGDGSTSLTVLIFVR